MIEPSGHDAWAASTSVAERGCFVVKTRHLLEVGGVDVYENGTIIHEFVFEKRDDVETYEPPFEYTREVTMYEAFTGFRLACAG